MAAGTPVVATRAGALPQTCGDAAVLVDDATELTAALTALLADAPGRARLRAAGLARARAFTWDRTAREIDALLLAEAAG
jgi:glycosyltransferase involved in cell wall biosynthesis